MFCLFLEILQKKTACNKLFLFFLQEEGWLMGVKDSTGQKGLFPANFTKII
jgi:hypothetical protein